MSSVERLVVALALFIAIGLSETKLLSELKFAASKLDTDHVDCKGHNFDVIDECGLQSSYSYRNKDFGYPTNQTALSNACKRHADAFKCLRAYAKCLPPLSKQVLIALVGSRQKYNKKVCTDKPTEASNKLLELNRCMFQTNLNNEKGVDAELHAIVNSEAITKSGIESVKDRVRHSCCSVIKIRKEFLDTTLPHCKHTTATAAELIDSFLSDTVGIICPDLENKARYECDKLAPLNLPGSSNARFFVKSILDVVQTLA